MRRSAVAGLVADAVVRAEYGAAREARRSDRALPRPAGRADPARIHPSPAGSGGRPGAGGRETARRGGGVAVGPERPGTPVVPDRGQDDERQARMADEPRTGRRRKSTG